MVSSTVRSPAGTSRTRLTLLIAWLVAGTLDISTAILYYVGPSGARAERLLQGIASGLLGARAFTGGVGTALIGLALHYAIALIWTLVLFAAFRTLVALRHHLVLTGIAYGVIVWVVMNLVVVPLSRAQHAPIRPQAAAIAALILIICIGLPISLVVGRHVRDTPN
jgi:hypothetical protein